MTLFDVEFLLKISTFLVTNLSHPNKSDGTIRVVYVYFTNHD